jgi:hypothetical protein
MKKQAAVVRARIADLGQYKGSETNITKTAVLYKDINCLKSNRWFLKQYTVYCSAIC